MSQQIPPPLTGYASPQSGVSSDARAMMYEASKKSMAVSYLLWFFFGTFGGHRFYNARTGSAVVQLLLTVFGVFLLIFYVGVLLLISVCIWVIIDAFLIPGWVRSHNSFLALQLGGR